MQSVCLLLCCQWFRERELSVVSESLRPCGLWPARPLPMGFSGKNTAVGCHFLLQGIFTTQGLNPHLPASPAVVGGFLTTWATWEAGNCSHLGTAHPAVHVSPHPQPL